MQRLEKKQQQLKNKTINLQQVQFKLEERFYKNVPKNERQQFFNYAQKIWETPLLHPKRSTEVIQAFWKEILRRSYLCSKLNLYQKHVHQYGQHHRQKFSLYYPNTKPSKLLPVVIFIHGGFFINGSQEPFQYLARTFVENGYILITMGFRQLPQFGYPYIYNDCHQGYLQLLEIVEKYGGDPNHIIFNTWSSGGSIAICNYFKYTQLYEKRVKLHISLGTSWQITSTQQKIGSDIIQHSQMIHELFPYGYLDRGHLLKIPIKMIVGTRDRDLPNVYDSNIKYYPIYKDSGLNVTLDVIENHDHYDLILNSYLSLGVIRSFEIQNICPNNQIAVFFSNGDINLKTQIDHVLNDKIWQRKSFDSINNERLDGIAKFRKMQNMINRDDYANYNKLFSVLEFFSVSHHSSIIKSFTHLSSCVTVNILGTEKHQQLLDQVSRRNIVFAFALTEAGGGNNISSAGTKAIYDHQTKEFIMHNETQFSKKFWAANLGMHANYAVVFAKLIVKNKNQGVHAFVIRIRDQNHKPLPGVTIQDLGHKIALNGIDNGTLMFNNYRVHKDSLLNRIGDIDQEGNYHSSISNINQRFFKAIQSLRAGRLFAASGEVGSLKQLCIMATTFSRSRFGISQTGSNQIPIGTYQLQQNDLIPELSKAIALLFFHQHCKRMFLNDPQNPQLSNLINFDKIFATQHAAKLAIVVRERCGGQGVLAINQLGQYIGTALAATTGQGDNRILIMKIAKDCLKLIGQDKLKLPSCDITKITEVNQLQNLDIIIKLLQARQISQFENLVTRMLVLKSERKQPYEIALKYTWQQTKMFSYAYGDRVVLQYAADQIKYFNDSNNIQDLKNYFVVLGLTSILDNLSFYAYSGLIPQQIATEMIELRNHYIRKSAQRIQLFIHKLGIPQSSRTAPISRSNYFKHIQNGLSKNFQIPSHL